MRYIFNCDKCGLVYLALPYTEVGNVKECPQCDSKNIERVYSPTASVWNCGGNCGKVGVK